MRVEARRWILRHESRTYGSQQARNLLNGRKPIDDKSIYFFVVGHMPEEGILSDSAQAESFAKCK